MNTKKYYVTMTDSFMNGWGQAQGMINKLVIVCDTYAEAEIVERNANRRHEMKYVNICTRRPSYNADHYLVSWHDRSDYAGWFTDHPEWN